MTQLNKTTKRSVKKSTPEPVAPVKVAAPAKKKAKKKTKK